jgi:hypothetical protein
VTLIASDIDSQLTGMKMFLKDTSFYGVSMDKLFNSSPELKGVLQNIMLEGILSGVVRPLNRTVFPSMEVEQAFRCACHDRDITRRSEQYLQRLLCCCIAFWCYISVIVIVFTVLF